jgi:hypothetical protein
MASRRDRPDSASPERRLYGEILARIASSSGGEGDHVVARADDAARAAEAEARAERDETERLKAAAKAIKREIADWKAWWDALPPERAPTEIAKLQVEVGRLAARLAETEAMIAQRIARHAHHHGLALALRARADAIATHGPAAELDIRASLESGLQAALAEQPTETAATPAPRQAKTAQAQAKKLAPGRSAGGSKRANPKRARRGAGS